MSEYVTSTVKRFDVRKVSALLSTKTTRMDAYSTAPVNDDSLKYGGSHDH